MTALAVEAHADAVADVFAAYADARAAGDGARVELVLDRAYALDPLLVDELLGFDYPAAA